MIIKKELFPSGGDNLTSDGWFQHCIICHAITANLILFEKHTRRDKTIEYYAHLCKDCIKLIKNPKKYPKITEKYEKKCNNLILRNTPTTYLENIEVETAEADYEESSPLW